MITAEDARANIGAGVVYKPGGHLPPSRQPTVAPEDGVITGVSPGGTIFVRYRGDFGAKATEGRDLTFLKDTIR